MSEYPPKGVRVKVTRKLGDILIARRDYRLDAFFHDPKELHWLNDDDKFIDIAINPVVSWEALPSIGQELVEALEKFSNKLRNGESIEAVRVERHETPDGPMHITKTIKY